MSQNPAKFRQYVSESSAQQNFTEGQIIQEWKKNQVCLKKTIYLSAPTKALINLSSWHLWTNNKLIVKQIMWVSWPKCLVARWSTLLKLIRKINWLSHNIVWNQQLDYLFNSIYRLTTTVTLWGESSDDRRDPLTKDLWWMLSMRWRHDQSKNVIKHSKDLIDTNPLTHPQTQTIPKKKNRSGASWYSNRSWLCPALLFLHQHASGYRQSFVSLVFHGREPDGVTSCYPISQDGGANRTKVGQSIFSI